MINEVAVKVGCSPELLEDAWELRRLVFSVEQRIDSALDKDGKDKTCTHAVVYFGEKPVAVGRLTSEGKIGRVAVLDAYRRKGYGVAVMEALEGAAFEQGIIETSLHSQESAIGFYQKIGYEPWGTLFEEAGIPHLEMRKQLTRNDPQTRSTSSDS